VVFENVPGTLEGSRVLTNFFSGKRMNMTMGFAHDLSKLELTDAFRDQYMSDMKTIPHTFIEDGPVLENIMEGDDIDVNAFPTPLWHDRDGGRYIGTGSYNVTQDPDTGALNVGTYRVMIQDKKKVGFYISPGKHGRIHRDKYAARGEKMPALVVCGGDPMMFLMASTEVPYGLCEYDLVGGYRGKAMQCIKGKVTGLPFPANAELVREGWVEPVGQQAEGPFGEWTGYYAGGANKEPAIRIETFMHRDNPILMGAIPAVPPNDDTFYRGSYRCGAVWNQLEAAGIPEVKGVWAHEAGGSRMWLTVAIKTMYGGHSKQAGLIASQCHAGAYANRWVIVVDDDIDPANLNDVIWSMCTRCDPKDGLDVLNGCWSTHLDPMSYSLEDPRNSRVVVDACIPFRRKDTFPIVARNSENLDQRIFKKFGDALPKA